jgi:hypothetical protein
LLGFGVDEDVAFLLLGVADGLFGFGVGKGLSGFDVSTGSLLLNTSVL